MFDAVVVGARCAGASAALLLARAGYEVLLVDRSEFPSDTMSTLYIHQPGVARLARWGVLDAVVASGCPKLDRVTYCAADVRLHGPAVAFGCIDGAYAPRRELLDQILVNAAVEAGASFRDGSRLVGVTGGDRVSGVVLRDSTGREMSERTRLVVGADGMRSTVARLASARTVVMDPLTTCVYYSFWRAVPAHFEFYERTGGWVAVIPTSDNLTVVAAYLPQDQFPAARKNSLATYLRAIRMTAPDVFSRVMAGERVGRLRGTGDQQNYFRQASGPGWVLIGDAGNHKDSITARGITDALVQAELLAQVIGSELTERDRLDIALRQFGEQRDAALISHYRNALVVGRLQLTESRLAFLRAISSSSTLTASYFGVVAGINSLNDLMTEELIALL
jgi:flavin-dependent dehydrogenase